MTNAELYAKCPKCDEVDELYTRLITTDTMLQMSQYNVQVANLGLKRAADKLAEYKQLVDSIAVRN